MTASSTPVEETARRHRIALIHATQLAIDPIEQAFREHWPDVRRFNLLEDSLTADRLEPSIGAAPLADRFVALSRYAQLAGATGILYTCSAFGAQIDHARRVVPLPTMKPNEAMLDEALVAGRRIRIVATFEPTLASMEDELGKMAAARGLAIDIEPVFVPGAMDALARGDIEAHDGAIAEAAARSGSFDVVLLAQFSMARARSRVAKAIAAPVLASPASAVAALRRAVMKTLESEG